MDLYTKANLDNWNERTPIHAASKFYDVAGFLSGKSTLKNIEREELGDVRGKTLLHLQCHFGLDTLSWARLGASVTGVDFSDKAIDLAKSLSKKIQLEARFICSEIYELPNVLREEFDIVFASHGVHCWISDIDRWMQIAAGFLKRGGIFYLIDGHPAVSVFGDDLQIAYPYSHSPEPVLYGPGPTYTGDLSLTTPRYEWTHSLSDIVNATIRAGLRIEFLHEFPFASYQAFPGRMQEENGWYVMKYPKIQIPLMFSVRATKE